ncbi:MAG: PilZ domain-containing protein [Candidatus Methylomirabilales bacterium]
MQSRPRRFSVRVPVVYTRLDQDGPAQTGVGWTEDLGERGACLKLSATLHLGWRLGLVIFAEPEVVEAEASVIWVRAGGQRNFCYHGLEFVHITPAYYDALLKALPPKKSLQRRAFRRVPLSLPVLCQVARVNTLSLEGQIGDISRAGVMILLPQQIPPRSRIDITFRPPSTKKVRGKVRWVANSKDASGMFRHGVEFVRGPLPAQVFLSLFSDNPGMEGSEGQGCT